MTPAEGRFETFLLQNPKQSDFFILFSFSTNRSCVSVSAPECKVVEDEVELKACGTYYEQVSTKISYVRRVRTFLRNVRKYGSGMIDAAIARGVPRGSPQHVHC